MKLASPRLPDSEFDSWGEQSAGWKRTTSGMPKGEVSMLKRLDDSEEAWSIKQLETVA